MQNYVEDEAKVLVSNFFLNYLLISMRCSLIVSFFVLVKFHNNQVIMYSL